MAPRRLHGIAQSLLSIGLAFQVIGCHESPSREQSPWTEQEILANAEFRDVFFLDENRGWIVGGGHHVDGGVIGETTDGGASWRLRTGIVANPRSRLFHLNAVHFHDESNGVIAAGGGRILRTVDAGKHWHTLTHAGRQLSSLFFLDDRIGWAAGEQWVLRTEDGGSSWTRVNGTDQGNDDFRARAVHFIDPHRGWLVGHHGALRRTQDGGRSWERLEAPLTDASTVLWAVQFTGPRSGWVVGDGGTILHSRDGGDTWAMQEPGIRADFRDVHFIDDHRGWVVGYKPSTGISSVLHTDDGGSSWTRQATIDGEALQALFFQPSGRGWAVGDRVRRKPQRLLRYTPSVP
jgi:photosystem II stability/assembly factor-like uncharacterized protein